MLMTEAPAPVAGAFLFSPGMLSRAAQILPRKIPPVADVDNLTSARKHCDAGAIAYGKVKAVVGYTSYTRCNEEHVPAIIDVAIHESDGWLGPPFLVSFLSHGLR